MYAFIAPLFLALNTAGLDTDLVCLIVLIPVAVLALDCLSPLPKDLKNVLLAVLNAKLSDAKSPTDLEDKPINSGTSPKTFL